MENVKNLSNGLLRKDFTAMEAEAIIYASSYCKQGDIFQGIPESSQLRYVNSSIVYNVALLTDTTLILELSTGKTLTCEFAKYIKQRKSQEQKPTPKQPQTTKQETENNETENKDKDMETATQQTTQGVNNDLMQGLNALFAAQMQQGYNKAKQESQTEIEALKAQIKDLQSKGSGTTINVTINGQTTTTKTENVLPEYFGSLCKLLTKGYNVFLYGAAGGGKNELTKELAKALNAKFYYFNTLLTKFDLTGYCDGAGRFYPTPLYNAVQTAKAGGKALVMLDEICSAAPEALVCLNAALANGYFTFGDSPETVSLKNIYFVAADNTNGQGANETYNGRFKMDESTRDRFFFQEVNYLDKIEKSIVGENTALLDFYKAIRESAKEIGISLVCGYRGLSALASLANDFEPSYLISGFILKGMERDTTKQLASNCKSLPNNIYYDALLSLAK